jgi:uncharacterized lipoprotein YmbA
MEMYPLCNRLTLGMIAVVMLAAAGCARTPPPNFYLLEEPAGSRLSGLDRGMAIGVGPLNLAGYLDRPNVVTRLTDHELQLSDFNRWAEPLKESILRVIGGNLSNMLETNRIYEIPWRNKEMPLEFRVEIDISRFDGCLGGDALLAARWTLYGRDEKTLVTRVSLITVASGGDGYDRLIGAQNQALRKLSQEIVDAIRANQ